MLLGAAATAQASPDDSHAPTQSALPTDAELEEAGTVIGDVFIDARDIFDLNDPR